MLVVLLSAVARAADPKLTVAVAYFDNNSGDAALDALSRGLADMLITDLSAVQRLQLVERQKLNLALDELKLSKSKFIDPKNALSLGKGLSARYLLTGGYALVKDTLRIDARLFDVAQGKVMFSEKVEGQRDEFFALEKELVDLLLKALDLKLALTEKSKLRSNPTESFDAFAKYSAGLVAADSGDEAKARQAFQAALDADPGYRAAKTASERVAAMVNKNDAARLQGIDSAREGLDPNAKDFAGRVEALLNQLDSRRESELSRKIALLTWLAEHDWVPTTNPKASVLAKEGLKLVERHVEDTKVWDSIPRACEYFLLRFPSDVEAPMTCKLMLKSLDYEKQTDRSEKAQAWEDDKAWDVKNLAPDDWRMALRNNEEPLRRLITLYASKVKR